MDSLFYLTPLFFITALIYSSVGFGGGSTYLALLVLFNFPYLVIPKVALICNLIVVTGGLYHYIKKGDFSFKHVLPFIITSIPFAYFGGSLSISKEVFLFLLGISLSIAGVRLLLAQSSIKTKIDISWKTTWGIGLPLGGFLGFLSGLVGIGGGIFLAPCLYFLRWGNARQIAASASFFIFVNSLFGLWGQWSRQTLHIEVESMLALAIAVLLGGQIGSRLSTRRISLLGLKRITAALILFVAGRILWGGL